MNAATIASDTIATLSVFRRRQASAHSPGETVCGISRGETTGLQRRRCRCIAVPVT